MPDEDPGKQNWYDKVKLSIVTTLYRSSPYVREFHRRATAVAQELVGQDYEIIYVNDGSPDDSLAIATQLVQSDEHTIVVDLSRNFGHHRAMMTGLSHSKGDRVFLIDSDLEEAPEWLRLFYSEMDGTCDVVYGIQNRRKGGTVEVALGWAFYRVFRLLTGINQPDNIVTARLMTRRYVNALISHQEREINIGGLWIITGFNQRALIVEKKSTSPTTYNFSRKLSHLVNAVTSFSSLPLVFIFYFGLVISAAAVAYMLYIVGRSISGSPPPPGYTSVLVSIWFFSGLIILFIGVVGIYISKIFIEVKRRPYSIVRQVYSHDSLTTKGP